MASLDTVGIPSEIIVWGAVMALMSAESCIRLGTAAPTGRSRLCPRELGSVGRFVTVKGIETLQAAGRGDGATHALGALAKARNHVCPHKLTVFCVTFCLLWGERGKISTSHSAFHL